MKIFLRYTILIALAASIGFSIYLLINASESNDYIRDLLANRTEKDIWLGSDFDSPFLKTNAPFHRLSYYEPTNDFIIEASLTKSIGLDSVSLITSSGETQWYHIYGTASFTLNDTTNVLLVLFQPGDKDLFIPFIDDTSGNSTYGAGRYLEANFPSDDKIILDFNMAYNPYCAYVEGYSCPFPPKRNRLKISIEAGEKSFHL